MKYLKNFKWDYLTEKFAYEKRVKENKLKVAMMQVQEIGNYSIMLCMPMVALTYNMCTQCIPQAKRSNAEIVQQIEKNEIQKHVEDRKRKRTDEQGDSGASDAKSNAKSADPKAEKIQRNFRQQHVIGTEYGEQLFKARPKLLSKVFAANKD